MGGWSGTSQARKLGLRPGQQLGYHRPPTGWELQDAPEDLTTVQGTAAADVILAFFTEANQLTGQLADLGQRVYPDGAVWVMWPRRATGHISDITENLIRDLALPLGLVDVKVAAVDEDWSGLRLVWRKNKR